MILVHPHWLGSIIPDPKTKGEGILSKGAQTFLLHLASQIVFDYQPELNTKEIQKGLACEQACIDLYNDVFGTDYIKNTRRIQTDLFSAECDIDAPDLVIDIKAPWSLATFPACAKMGIDKDYEYQLRAYMMLYDKPRARLAYCMVSTPEDLLRYEDPTLHFVDHIDPNMRVTTIDFERDATIEANIIAKSRAAQEFVTNAVDEIYREHQER